MNELCHACEWHTHTPTHTQFWAMKRTCHTNEYLIERIHHTNKSAVSHPWMRHVTHTNDTHSHAHNSKQGWGPVAPMSMLYRENTSHKQIGHIAHMNEFIWITLSLSHTHTQFWAMKRACDKNEKITERIHHTHKAAISHTCMRYVTHINDTHSHARNLSNEEDLSHKWVGYGENTWHKHDTNNESTQF